MATVSHADDYGLQFTHRQYMIMSIGCSFSRIEKFEKAEDESDEILTLEPRW